MKPIQQWDSTDIEVKRVHQAFSVWRNQTGGGPGHRIPDELWAQAVRLCERYNRSDVSDYLRLDRGRLRRRCKEASSIPTAPSAPVDSSFVELNQAGVADVLLGGMNCPAQVELQGIDGSLMRLHLGELAVPQLESLCRSFWGNSAGGAQRCSK